MEAHSYDDPRFNYDPTLPPEENLPHFISAIRDAQNSAFAGHYAAHPPPSPPAERREGESRRHHYLTRSMGRDHLTTKSFCQELRIQLAEAVRRKDEATAAEIQATLTAAVEELRDRRAAFKSLQEKKWNAKLTALLWAHPKQAHKIIFRPQVDFAAAAEPDGLRMLYDPHTNRTTDDPDEIRRLTQAHFSKLAAPSKGEPTSDNPFPWETPNLDPITIAKAGDQQPLIDLFTEELFLKILAQLPNGKAPGPDGLAYETLKWLAPPAKHAIFTLLHTVYADASIPAQLKVSKIWLLFKKGSPTSLANYRPISLANAIAKLFTACVSQLMAEYADKHTKRHTDT